MAPDPVDLPELRRLAEAASEDRLTQYDAEALVHRVLIDRQHDRTVPCIGLVVSW